MCGLVVTCGDGAELLEFGEEVLDQMARLAEKPIERPRCSAIGLRGTTTVLPESGILPSLGDYRTVSQSGLTKPALAGEPLVWI